jgi:predicted PurR-regulated permease PerM
MTTRYIVGIGLFILGLFVLYLSRSILSTVIIAALITFLVKPLIIFLNTKLRSPKGLTIAIVYAIVVIVILVAPLILLPPLVTTFNTILSYDYQTLLQDVIVWAERTLLDLKFQQSAIPGFDPVVDSIVDPLLQVLQDTEPITIPQLPPVPDILAFYREEVDTLLTKVTSTMGAWLRGNITLMVVIGVTVWIGNLILGTPNAFFLGVISGLFELIPNIGPALALIPAVLVALTQGSSHIDVSNFSFAIIVLIFYLLVQVLENNFVVPRVMGQELELHPLVVLIGILVGAASFGVLGALLAAPVIAMAKVVLKYLYLKVLGEDPFPPEAPDAEKSKSSWLDKTRDVSGRVSSIILRRTRKGAAGSIIDETSADSELKDQETDLE